MQLHDLNKNQVILLTLLISFVTSIATGIITVSLLQEAPLEVTRNINRIVEKTIETVTPSPTVLIPVPKDVTTTTVVVKEEDLVISSIDKNIKSIVRIKERDPILDVTSFYSIGLVVGKDGLVATDRKIITPANSYSATMSDGTVLPLTPLGVDKQTNFILFKTASTTPSQKTPYVFVPATLGEQEPKLGQTVISLGGDSVNAVSVGRVVTLETKESGTGTSTVKYLSSIDTDVSSKDLVDGSPLFNLSGDVVGIQLLSNSPKTFTPISTGSI